MVWFDKVTEGAHLGGGGGGGVILGCLGLPLPAADPLNSCLGCLCGLEAVGRGQALALLAGLGCMCWKPVAAWFG